MNVLFFKKKKKRLFSTFKKIELEKKRLQIKQVDTIQNHLRLLKHDQF